MIGRLYGKILEKQPPYLLLDVNGVGYEVSASMTTFYQLPELDKPVVLYTHLVVREDAHVLYGFSTQQERTFFKSLIKINGVGPKLALAILSGISGEEFVLAVQNDDITRLTRLPGIGKKTAERLIVEMRDKISDWMSSSPQTAVASETQIPAAPSANQIIQEATSALITLGYKPVEASKMVSKLDKTDKSSEDLIKMALKNSLG